MIIYRDPKKRAPFGMMVRECGFNVCQGLLHKVRLLELSNDKT